MPVEALNYAESYQSALDQAFPYVLNFGALYNTPNNGRFSWVGADSIKIGTIRTTGRTDADRDVVTGVARNYDNLWQTKQLMNHRKWKTSIHPMDIDETNFTATIANITNTFNDEQKFPEMDAYCISKLFHEWLALNKTAVTTPLDISNILKVFDDLMVQMTDKRVPTTGRILYVTPQVNQLFRSAKDVVRSVDLKDGGTSWNTLISSIDKVQFVEVSSELMNTLYDFSDGWKIGAGAKQIQMLLIHPMAVITPVKYAFSKLDAPGAMSDGKWIYYEESYEDVFILNNKADAIAFVTL